MRKIEKEMLRAINERTSWMKDNTEVRMIILDDNAISQVFLHGNHIADFVHAPQWGVGWIEPNRETLANWPTPTTKSRLWALGVNLTQSRGVISIDGEVVCHV
jgi:hypothetical protein